MMEIFLVAASLIFVLIFGYLKAPLWLWILALPFLTFVHFSEKWAVIVFLLLVVVGIPVIRRYIVSWAAMKLMKKVLPPISETEQVALDAGVVWVESDFFEGKPQFKKWTEMELPTLTKEEENFLNHETEELCLKTNDWEVWKKRGLSDEIMNYIIEKKFFSMNIPKHYGGLGFTPYAHSRVIEKLSSRSLTLAVTVMVPNSLGPAELLLHYGTERQKDHYLPRLAQGEEIPCFGLTEPKAGSDAGSIESEGVLYKRDDGKIGLRLNWNKRWITLSGIATLIGVAFCLKDPEKLLSDQEDRGITLALVPSHTPGVIRGRRHDPMSMPFNNCPIQGESVELVAEEAIIGGLEKVGEGWKMLMACLGMGRGISLPSQSASSIKLSHAVTTAYSLVRQQFGVSIGQFEGIKEPLSFIGASNYWNESLRLLTLRALVDGVSPPVITAIAKYQSTETARTVLLKAMDIMAGKGVSMGPKNPIAGNYIGTPIGITVEGANILTRTLMIFGQGLLRAHPYAYQEIKAVQENDLKKFDKLFFSHIGHVLSTACRSIVLSLSRGYCYRYFKAPKGTQRHYQHIAWASASFSLMSDVALALLGGRLKFQEKLTGQFADILSWLYISSSVLWRYEKEGAKKEDLAYVNYTCELALYRVQKAFDILLKNFKVPYLSWIFKLFYDWSRFNQIQGLPSGKLENQLYERMIDVDNRKRMIQGIFIPENDSFHALEKAFYALQKTKPLRKKLKKAMRAQKISKKLSFQDQLQWALDAQVFTEQEAGELSWAESLRDEAIQVDSFSKEEFASHFDA